ncbi:hypothetical protein HMPREF0653_02565 [Prevotella disiens JCM 6334 = ATCC 29426]|uniref:Uncharacterized protein n=1 Tax=Prevotella disiens JCM 6334 = ATCC 29426 TaxID=1235811 RepID=A0ABP2Y3X2_9BACT|nr:hypothetical protein HMPREF0653_02565 [Prevotella disiens JCM 6334 = ATCC 29426]
MQLNIGSFVVQNNLFYKIEPIYWVQGCAIMLFAQPCNYPFF